MSSNKPCPLCNGTHFTYGETRPKQGLKFPDSGFWASVGFGGDNISARRCNGCGNVQLFTIVPYAARQSESQKRKREQSLLKKEDDYFE